MKVKTFRGRSVQQAISRIKSEIGPEAVIMSTKRVPENRTNPYGAQVFEVTASVPESNDYGDAGGRVFPEPKTEKNDSLSMRKNFNEYIEDIDTDEKGRGNNPDEIYKEILSIKDILFTLQSKGGLPEYIFKYPGASSVYAKLIENGISSELSKKIILKSYSKEKKSESSPGSLRKRVFIDMINMIDTYDPFEINDSAVAAAFIGPTGVGKTTTIAKVAADLTINQGKKVGLVSVDNYRIGALEQLKTYSTILGIPCMPAFDKSELEKALSRMRSKDVILIDTAGLSSFDEEKIKELKDIFDPSIPVSTHLVLSLTSSLENLNEASKNFSELTPSSYIFTKLDETLKKGAVLDQLDYMKLPVSYVTNGQRVPEDFEKASGKNILKKIFTEK
jgi:flagellar biosynthesis protein FlhF